MAQQGITEPKVKSMVETHEIKVSAETMGVLNEIAEADGSWQLAKAIWHNFTVREILRMPWATVKSWWTGRLP